MMKASTLLSALVVFGSVLGAHDLVVDTPAQLVTCQPALLEWQGGTPPFFVEIIPGGEVGASPLETFPTQEKREFTWDVDIAAGTSITVEVRDSTGVVSFSAPVTIEAGPSTSCLGTS